ncbi:MAG: response regulator [Deltaproteobacteria bacterium]|nr:response regulator [Deltaproteobacteria bacterium]
MERKILVVDDETVIRDLFDQILSAAGYDVRVAESGEQALGILKEEPIEVIFLDLKLFGMNGIELCRQIRSNHPLAIINAITGWAALFEIEECREAGFDDYFVKPVDMGVISRAVEGAFERIERWKRKYPRK